NPHPHGGKAQRDPAAAAPASPRTRRADGAVAGVRRARLLHLSRRAREHAYPRYLPAAGDPTLAAAATPAQSEEPHELATTRGTDPAMDTHTAHPASISERPV